MAAGNGKKKFFQKFLPQFRSFPVFQYIAVRKGKNLSETEVLQMQTAMREPAERDEEIIDILIAISVVSKRLAEKLRKLNKKETTT